MFRAIINFLLFISMGVGITACSKTGSGSPAANQKKQSPLEELKVRTIRDLVFVEGGTFMQGDVGYEDENGRHRDFSGDRLAFPAHPVQLSNYSIQKFEVTFLDYDLFARKTGRPLIDEDRRYREHKGPAYPVRNVLWQEARDYCNWLGNLIGYPMELPTEAQWEFAARSRGRAVAHATNNGDIEYGVNYRNPSENKFGNPVGTWPPNPLGLYDMSGNAMEWTLDYFHVYKASEIPLVDPSFTAEDRFVSKRVARGTGVIGGKGVIALYIRFPQNPDKRNGDTGFRCVANVKQPINN